MMVDLDLFIILYLAFQGAFMGLVIVFLYQIVKLEKLLEKQKSNESQT